MTSSSAYRAPLLVGALFVLLALPAPQTPSARASERERKEIYGWVEEAVLVPYDRKLKAKLDTGALTSSLDAVDVEEHERDGESWVSFTVPARDDDEEDLRLHRPLHRDVTIEGHEEDDHRLVVLVDVCLGSHVHRIQVSLADRRAFNYPLLVGRRLLEEVALVDASATFLSDPYCEAGEEAE